MLEISNKVLVRPLKESDFDCWYGLWRSYQEFYKSEIPLETSKATWDRLLDEKEPMYGAIAQYGDENVGIAHWIFHRSCWTVENYCYLEDLFVSPKVRGLGLGRKLIEHVYSEAKKKECAKVYWLTHETNEDAMKLYDRIASRSGFIHYRKTLRST